MLEVKDDLTCRELIEFLMDYLDGVLPQQQSRLFDEHLAACGECTAYVHSYRETVKLAATVCAESHDDIPEDVPEDLVAAIMAAQRASRDS